MGDADWGTWLTSITGEQSVRGIARKVGVSHTQVQRWLKTGVPPDRVAEFIARFGADPIEALVLTGWLRDEHVQHLNYRALARYIPLRVLEDEIHVRIVRVTEEVPDSMRKTHTGYGMGRPHVDDIAERRSFRLTAKA